MPFIASRCGLIRRGRTSGDFCPRRPERLRSSSRYVTKRRAFYATLQDGKEKVGATLSKEQKPTVRKSVWKEKTRREMINFVLTSSKASLVVVCVSTLLYLVVLLLLAHRVTVVHMANHERILLVALSILIPDFRYSVRTYLEAVDQLKRYRPPSFPFSMSKSSRTKDVADEVVEPTFCELFGLDPATTELLTNVRSRIDSEIAKFDSIMSNVKRDMARPIVETSNQIQQLVGTDLTLRKNVLIAAITIFLSLLGCFTSAAGETGIGCVIVMIAALLPSAILAPRRHELLILVNDGRVMLSLFGTVASVACAFFPMTAAYLFLIACIGLVAARVPMHGI